MENIAISILLILIGFFTGIILMIVFNSVRGFNAVKKAEKIIDDANKEASKIKKDYLLEAKEEAYKNKKETEEEIKEKKKEIKSLEDRLMQRESNIDRRDGNLQKREQVLNEREQDVTDQQKSIQKELEEIGDIKEKQLTQLEQITKISRDEAKKQFFAKVEETLGVELANFIKEKEAEAKLTAERKAQNILVEAMQRYANDVAVEQTVTVINLPSDDVKGKIIGREGRNIRTIEAVTGVDLIIDDTPEALVVSSFDPLRREIARVTIENLIRDGRIHPARIEELYDKTCKEIKVKIREYGEEALFNLGITKVDPNIVEFLGKLHFRTSYGQNALMHSVEVANLTGIMASELGENVALAKRAGLLHDIGKAIDHDVEGSHVDIGIEIAEKHKEDKVVIDAIASHHDNVEANSLISILVAIADALSATRPGARNDSLENYIKRLQELEAIANDIKGVEKSYAIQAGRELRIIVEPTKIDDSGSYKIARDVKTQIEEKLQYPGTIKVTVIREVRATEEAI